MKYVWSAFALVLLAVATLLAACGSKSASSSAAGNYELVKNQALIDGLKATAANDNPELTAAKVEEMLKPLAATLVLKEDGTFTIRGNMGAAFEASGTWTLAGKDLTLTSTRENGKDRKTPEINKVVLEGDTITFPKDPKSQPFAMVLRRT